MSHATGSHAVATDEATDSRYAWVMLPVAILMHAATSPAQTFGVSLFNEPIRQSLGLSHSLLTGSYLVASLLAAVPLMYIGRQMDRHGLKLVTFTLITIVGLSCVYIANVSTIFGLTLAFFLLRAFGQGGLSMAAGNTLGTWFVRRLGLASGIAGVGMSVAIALMPWAYLQLIEALGWRTAYTAIGTATLAIMLPVILLVYRNNPQIEQERKSTAKGLASVNALHSDDYALREALRTPAYWIASTCTALTGLICTAVFFNLVPLFQLQGLTAAQAAAVYPIVALAMAVMQIKGGLLADRLPLGWLMAAAMTALAAGVLVLGNAHALIAAQLGAVLIGGGQGLMAVTGNTLWPRYFGRRHLGAIRSSVWTATVAACSAGPFVMGVTLDFTGGYGPSLWLFVGLAATAGVAAAIGATPPEPEQAVPNEVTPSPT